MTKIADPDSLVSGMDSRIRIWIHTKMSWIRNTARSKNEIDCMSILERRPGPTVVFDLTQASTVGGEHSSKELFEQRTGSDSTTLASCHETFHVLKLSMIYYV
jgi:hypothetical protein